MECGSQVGLDIGGSLCKIAVFVPTHALSIQDSVLRVASSLMAEPASSSDIWFAHEETLEVPGGEIYFLSLPSAKLTCNRSATPSMTRSVRLFRHPVSLSATGGGAHKFERDLLAATSALNVNHLGEIQALFEGLEFLLRYGDADEVFVLKNVRFAGMIGKERERIVTEPLTPRLCIRKDETSTSSSSSEGFLVVNIGSGVSFVDFDGKGSHVRVGGSSLGGATFFGLVTMLCGVSNFEEALNLAANGDSTAVDLLVGDIYSETGETNKRLEDLGLRASTLAASFGKLATSAQARAKVRREDLALACLIMIALNLAAMAYLHASTKDRRVILFVGSFLGSGMNRRNTLACRTLTYGVEFWGQIKSKPMKAAFLKHEGYLGALGALQRSEGDAVVFKQSRRELSLL